MQRSCEVQAFKHLKKLYRVIAQYSILQLFYTVFKFEVSIYVQVGHPDVQLVNSTSILLSAALFLNK